MNNNNNGLGSMPTFDEKVKNRAKAQSDFQLQQAIMNAPKDADPNTVANQVSAQAATQQAAQTTQQQSADLQSQLNQNTQILNNNQYEIQGKEQKKQAQLMQDRRNNENELSSFNSEIKNKLVDQEKQFNKVKGENQIKSQQQMSDYLVSQQASQEEWLKFEQAQKIGHQRKMNTLRNSHAVIKHQLDNNMQEIIRDYGQEKADELQNLERELNEKLRKEQEKGSLIGVVAGVGQMVVGGVLVYTGNPMGATMIMSGAMQTQQSYGNGDLA